jgi:transcriptional regulator with XRE-family HTH domain
VKKISTAARFKLVVEELYKNNLAKAALALGLDRSTVSRYVSGRNPPLSILLLVSRLTNVDIDWLTKGTELKIRYAKENYSGEVSRPVISTPCAGAPDHTTPKFGMEFRQVAPAHNVPNRYWLRLTANIKALDLLKRDLVLMEAILPRSATPNDVGCLRIVLRGDQVEVAVLIQSDVKSDVQVLAFAHLVERDLN